jgi:uncharacterized membrane protein
MKTWHKIGLGFGIALAIISWIISIYYWGKLPTVIPTHFGINGLPDSWNNKSIWYVFLMPTIQTLIAGGIVFITYNPQYSDMPTTLWLMTMEQHKREHAFDLIRTMLVGTGLWVGVLFVYMNYAMNAAALQTDTGLNNWIVFTLVGGMLIWLVWWTVKVYKATREAIKKEA